MSPALAALCGDGHITAHEIADAMIANCRAYDIGAIDRTVWSDEQNRLWRIAAEHQCARHVMRVVCPSLGAAV